MSFPARRLSSNLSRIPMVSTPTTPWTEQFVSRRLLESPMLISRSWPGFRALNQTTVQISGIGNSITTQRLPTILRRTQTDSARTLTSYTLCAPSKIYKVTKRPFTMLPPRIFPMPVAWVQSEVVARLPSACAPWRNLEVPCRMPTLMPAVVPSVQLNLVVDDFHLLPRKSPELNLASSSSRLSNTYLSKKHKISNTCRCSNNTTKTTWLDNKSSPSRSTMRMMSTRTVAQWLRSRKWMSNRSKRLTTQTNSRRIRRCSSKINEKLKNHTSKIEDSNEISLNYIACFF